MARAQVTVRGAGIFGLSVAWACVERGARVRVVDPKGPGAGASGGIVGALAPHVPDAWNEKKAFQLRALLAQRAFWAEVEGVSGLSPGYRPFGRLQPVPDDAARALAETRADAARHLWEGRAGWRLVEARGRDWAPFTPTGWLVEDTLSASLHPGRAVAALAAALSMRGAEIVEDAPDEGLVLHATGWEGLAHLSKTFGRDVGGGVKGQAVLLRHAAPARAPQIFADGLHIVPHDDGTVAIGSTSERTFESPDTCDDQADALVDRAAAILPILKGASVVRCWAGVRPRAISRAPLLGPWPGRAGHFIANGGFKIGFGIAPEVGRVMADLMLDGRDCVPGPFRVHALLT